MQYVVERDARYGSQFHVIRRDDDADDIVVETHSSRPDAEYRADKLRRESELSR